MVTSTEVTNNFVSKLIEKTVLEMWFFRDIVKNVAEIERVSCVLLGAYDRCHEANCLLGCLCLCD